MQFLLFDKDEQYIDRLQSVSRASHYEEINGEDILTIVTRDRRPGKGHRVVFQSGTGEWKEFVVKEVEKTHSSHGLGLELYCESSFYETLGDFVEDKRPQNVTATAALGDALLTTRWQVGTVDDLGLESTNFYRISAKEAVQRVATVWKGEIRTRVVVSGSQITGRFVDILTRRGGDYGKRFSYTRNLDRVTKTVHRNDVITALYGFGKGEYIEETGGWGRRVDFTDINSGKAYVEDHIARVKWGRNDGSGGKVHVFGVAVFDQIEDPVELKALTESRLEELSEPWVTYDCTAADFGGADLGDYVRVIDREFEPELRMSARVVAIKRDLLDPEKTEATLGNFRPSIIDDWAEQESYINNFRDRAGVWDRAGAFNPDGTLGASWLDGLVDELNSRMNSQGGYVYISDDGGGLITYDRPLDQNPTMAIQILGGAFRIANSRDPSGEWEWRSFGDGSGFLADEFIGGTLRGGKVHFTLSDGTLLIGNSTENYNLYWDGSSLNIRGHIKMSNGQDLEEVLEDIETTPGPPGEDAITLHIDSSNGYTFKNTGVSTIMTVTVVKGGLWIDTANKLEAEFGEEAYLQWQEKKLGESVYSDIPRSDDRLSDGGFIFTVTAADIQTKSTFRCILTIEEED